MDAVSAEPRLSRYLHAGACSRGIPLAGTFELTARCNFDCKMCYVHLSPEQVRQRGQELTADQWLSVARQAQSRGMLFLLLTGGEPLLRPDFPYLLRELKKLGLMISVNSNGSLIGEELLAVLRKDPPFRFNITLYGGSDRTYEALCGRPAYEGVVRNIKALTDIGIGVKLNVSLTPWNCEDLEAVFALGRQLQVPVQAASYMFPPLRRDRHMIGKNCRFSPGEAARCSLRWDLLRFTPEQFSQRARAIRDGLRQPEESDCQGAPGEGIACRAGRSSFWIDWKGNMTPCGMMPEPACSVPELGFDAAWQQTKQAAGQIRLPGACSVCRWRHACHVCAAMCLTETGKFDGRPDYICAMTEETVRLTLEKENLL